LSIRVSIGWCYARATCAVKVGRDIVIARLDRAIQSTP
jgi:hypothetical protein